MAMQIKLVVVVVVASFQTIPNDFCFLLYPASGHKAMASKDTKLIPNSRLLSLPCFNNTI